MMERAGEELQRALRPLVERLAMAEAAFSEAKGEAKGDAKGAGAGAGAKASSDQIEVRVLRWSPCCSVFTFPIRAGA